MVGLLMDKYASQILLGTAKKPKGIREISRDYNIPVSVCYRRIKKLVDMGLLTEVRYGKRAKYRSNIEDFRAVLNFEENKLYITMTADGEEFEAETSIL